VQLSDDYSGNRYDYSGTNTNITTTKEITFPPFSLFPDADLNPASRQFLKRNPRIPVLTRRGAYSRVCVLLVLNATRS